MERRAAKWEAPSGGRNAQHVDLSTSESPEFLGRVVAALAQDQNLMGKSGTVQVAASLGLEYDAADIDGRRPAPLTRASE